MHTPLDNRVSTITNAVAAVAQPDMGELVRRSQGGDSVAFEALYRAHVGKVYALCLRLSGDANQATEMTQDVFIQAWKGLASYRGEAAFGTWLHRLAFNVVRQGQRSQNRRNNRIQLREDLVEAAVGKSDTALEDRMELERAIATLPPRARQALILHDIHGYRCREVAELTGSAVGTIQAHLHRARKMLKEVLVR